MTLLQDVRIGAQRPRSVKLPPGRVSSAGPEVVDLAEILGVSLHDWQSWWLDEALAEDGTGDWCARENVLITGRQSGKNICLAMLEFAGLFVLGDPLIIHSAHEVPTALSHFQFMVGLLDECPELNRLCRPPTLTNGREAIRLRSGQRLVFRARMKDSGRGLTAGRLVFDEAFKIDPASMGALLPTLRAIRNTQITYASSAPKADSAVLHSLIRRGDLDDPADRLFLANWGNPQGTRLDDVDGWYQANPSLGLRIEERTLHDEYRSLVSSGDEDLIAEFAREAVGIPELPVGAESKPVKLPADRWATSSGHVLAKSALPLGLAFDVSKDGLWSSIAVAAGDLAAPYVEVVEHRQGTGWLPGRVAELAARYGLVPACNGAGATGALVGPVQAALTAAGVGQPVRQLSGREYSQACGGLYVDVVEGRLRRPSGQGPLDVAAGDAGERLLGDAGGFAWDQRSASVPLCPLVAVTVARACLPVVAAVGPVFAW